MVRLAADALGASVIPVRRLSDGMSEATIALPPGNTRLSLPLAAVDRGGNIQRATRAWDEETGSTPGNVLPPELIALLDVARDSSGRIVQRGAYCARQGQRVVWIALRPSGTRELARDVLAGLVHEPVLAAVDDTTMRLLGYAQGLGLALGLAPDMWLHDQLQSTLPSTCRAFGVTPPSVVGDGRAAPPPHLIAFLTREGGGGVLQEDAVRWSFVPTHITSPLMAYISVDGVVQLPAI